MFRLETEVDGDRRVLIERRLRETNSARSPVLRAMRGTPEEENDPLQVYALDEHGELAGGLVGHTWGRWLHIGLLWVDEPARGSGLGTRLVARAEEIARDERRCLHARVESWDFQAPAF